MEVLLRWLQKIAQRIKRHIHCCSKVLNRAKVCVCLRVNSMRFSRYSRKVCNMPKKRMMTNLKGWLIFTSERIYILVIRTVKRLVHIWSTFKLCSKWNQVEKKIKRSLKSSNRLVTTSMRSWVKSATKISWRNRRRRRILVSLLGEETNLQKGALELNRLDHLVEINQVEVIKVVMAMVCNPIRLQMLVNLMLTAKSFSQQDHFLMKSIKHLTHLA